MKRTQFFTFGILFLIIFTAAFFRLYSLSSPDFTFNVSEFSVESYGKNYLDFATEYSMFHATGSPTLYFNFLSLGTGLFGLSEFGTRIFSVLFGILLVFAVFLIGKHFYNVNVGLLSSAIFAVSWSAIWNSRTGEVDTFLALLASLAILLFYLWLERKNSFFFYASCFLVGLSIAAKFTGLLLLVILSVFLFFEYKFKIVKLVHSKLIWFGIILVLAGFFVGTPYYFIHWTPLDVDSATNNFPVPYGVKIVGMRLLKHSDYSAVTYFQGQVTTWNNLPAWFWLYRLQALIPLFILVLLLGLALLYFYRNRPAFLLGFWFFLSLAFFTLLNPKEDYYIIFFLAPIIVLASAFIVKLFSFGRIFRIAAVAIIAVILTSNVYYAVHDFPFYVESNKFKDEAKLTAVYLQDKLSPGDSIMGYPVYRMRTYLYGRDINLYWHRFTIPSKEQQQKFFSLVDSGKVNYYLLHKNLLQPGVHNELVGYVVKNFKLEKVITNSDGEEAVWIYNLKKKA